MYTKTLEKILYQFKAYFDPYLETRLSDWYSLVNYLELKEMKSKTIIKKAGEKENSLRFILTGAGAKLLKEDFREICLDLCFENDFLSDFGSLLTGQATNVYIRTFEPSTVLVIKEAKQFYSTFELGDKIRWVIGEQQQKKVLKANTVNRGKKLEDRYLNFLEGHPDILLRTPVNYLASYMGMSRKTLNRIRKKMAQQ